MPAIRGRLAERVETTLGAEGCQYLVIEQGESIAGVSGIAREHWTDQNLLTGVCVAAAHQRRGLGRYLLQWSLTRLREMGLATAQVYTHTDSVAANKLYSQFSSHREEGVLYPGTQPRG
jgi:N-acetylglutamate synthase-like GNAT family acetyltransferase